MHYTQPVSAALTSLVLHDTLSQSVSQQPLRHSSCTTHSASQCHSSPYVTRLARHTQPVSVTAALTSLVLHDTLSQSVSQQPLRHSSCTTLSASQCHSSPYVTRLARHTQPVSVTAALTSLVLHDTLSQSVSQQPLRHSSCTTLSQSVSQQPSPCTSQSSCTRLARHTQPVSVTAALTSLVLHDTLSQSVSQQPLRHSSCTTLSASQCHSSPYVTRLARHSQPVSVTAALTSLVLHDTLSQSVSQQPLRHSSCTTLSASQCHSSPYVTRLARHSQPVSVTAALTSLVLHDTLSQSVSQQPFTSLVLHSSCTTLSQSVSQQPLRHSSCTTLSASQCHSSPYVTRLARHTQPVSVTAALTSLVLHDTLSQSVSQQPLRHSSCTTLSASQCHSSPYVTRLARHSQPVSVTAALTSLVLHDTLSQSVSQQPLRHSSCTTLSASQCHSSPYVTRLARHSQPVSVTAALTSLVLHDTLSQSVSQQPLRHSSCTTLSASQCHSSPYVTRLARHSQPVSVTAALTSLVLHDTLSQSVSQQPLRHSSCTTHSASQCHSSPYVTRLARHSQPVSVTAALTSLVLHDTLSQSVSQQPLRHSSCTTLSASQCHSSPYVTRLARHSQPVSVTAALTSLVLHDTLSQSVSQQPLRHSSCTTHSASQCHSSPYVTRLARHSQPVSVTTALTSLVLHDTLSQSVSQQPLRHSSCTTLSQSVSQQPLRHSSCTTHSASQCHSSPYVTRLARHSQPVSAAALECVVSLVLHDTLSQSVSQQPLRHSSCTTHSASQCHSSPYVTRLARHSQPVSVTAALTSLVLHDTLSQSVSQQPLRHSSCMTLSASQCHSSPYVTRLARHSQPVSVTAALSLVSHDTLSQSVSQQPLRHSSCTTLSQSVSQQPLRHSSCTTHSASQCHSSPYVTRLARHSQPVSVTAALTSLVLHYTQSQCHNSCCDTDWLRVSCKTSDVRAAVTLTG